MKQYLAFIFLILSIGLVMADTISETNINLKIQNNTLNITNSAYFGNNQLLILNVTNGTIGNIDLNFSILFIKNESVDKTLVEQYVDCIAAKGACDVEKSQFNMGWNLCRTDLIICQSNNNESVKQNLNDCNLDKQRIQLDLDAKTKDLNTCNEDIKGNSNSKFIWAAGGGLLVFVIMMFVTGKWGNQNKDKSQEEFNPNRGY